MTAIRAIIYGLGRVNRLATRLLLEKGVDVVGAVNRSGPKIGKDLGEVAGLDRALGIQVSDDPREVLALPADIVLVGVHDDMERMYPIFEQCLNNGLNVISVGAHHSYPWRIAPNLTSQLDALAKANGVTISASGSQDFFMVNLPALMSGACHRVDEIHHRSLSDVNNFGAEVADIAHVGLSVEEFAGQSSDQRPSVYSTFWENLASALDLELLGITQTDEPVIVSEPRLCRSLERTIEPGRVVGTRTRLMLSTAEGVQMRGDYELSVLADAKEYKEWEIIGEPGFTVRSTDLDTGFFTTSQYVNRIAHVIEAPPGYITLEKLPKLIYRSQLTR